MRSRISRPSPSTSSARYIERKSGYPERALAYVRRLRERTEKLQTGPFRGRERDDIRPGLRVVPVARSAVIAFDVDEEKGVVRVLNYFHGGRDYETLLRSRTEGE